MKQCKNYFKKRYSKALAQTTNTSECDFLSNALLNLTEIPKTTFRILKDLISYEIGRHSNPKSIFRVNNLPSKILGQYVK
jgi:hypothetical protein